MERLKNMGLKRCFFLLSVLCLATALALMLSVNLLCEGIAKRYPQGGLSIDYSTGVFKRLEEPDQEQRQILDFLSGVQLFSVILFPVGGLGIAGVLFYHLKLKRPIAVLRMGTERIRNQDLNFSMPEISTDELGQICAAFELMRAELLKTNQELWQQAEERKRLNAAFAHDLRNPITVLKGSIRLLKSGRADEHTLKRMDNYVQRIEQYVEAMSSIQRLEQLHVQFSEITDTVLREELEETACLLAPKCAIQLSVADLKVIQIDHGIFLTVAENLMGNAARFAREKLEISLTLRGDLLCLTVSDDGSGFPERLLKHGPKPFEKLEESPEHFGMGLYGSSLLCLKHGGELRLKNRPSGGAEAMALFQIKS